MKGKIHIPAVIFTVFLHQVIGFLWYSPYILGERWLALIGKSVDELKSGGAAPYVIAIIGSILICVVLTKLIHATKAATATEGVNLGFQIWLGFILPVIAIHYLFQGRGFELVLIDSGHSLIDMITAGAVLSLWRKN